MVLEPEGLKSHFHCAYFRCGYSCNQVLQNNYIDLKIVYSELAENIFVFFTLLLVVVQ